MFYCLCVYYIPFIIFKSYGVFIDGKCCFNCDICRNVGISARIGCRIVAPFDKMVAFIRYGFYLSTVTSVLYCLCCIARDSPILTYGVG